MKNRAFAKQKGMVLVTGLIFLILLTILGTVSISSTLTAEKMTQNLRDLSASFGAAESALTDGEVWISNQAAVTSTCTTAPCTVWQANSLGNFYKQPDSWWQSNGRAYSSTLYGVVSQPRYIIEQLYYVPFELSPDSASRGQGYYYYRVTSRGNGATTSAYSVVQSVYAIQYY